MHVITKYSPYSLSSRFLFLQCQTKDFRFISLVSSPSPLLALIEISFVRSRSFFSLRGRIFRGCGSIGSGSSKYTKRFLYIFLVHRNAQFLTSFLPSGLITFLFFLICTVHCSFPNLPSMVMFSNFFLRLFLLLSSSILSTFVNKLNDNEFCCFKQVFTPHQNAKKTPVKQ